MGWSAEGGGGVAVMGSDLPAGRPETVLVATLDALGAEALGELPGVVALQRAQLLLASVERLRALALKAVADVETRQLHTLADMPSVAAWASALAVGALDRHDVALARRLATMGQVAAELSAGTVSCEAAALVAAALAKARPHLDRPGGCIDGLAAEEVLHGVVVEGIAMLLAEATGGAVAASDQVALRAALDAIVARGGSQRDRLEAGLLFFAGRCPAGLLRCGLEVLLDALLPAEHEKRARRAQRQAGLDLHRNRAGSGWWIGGELDDETGELLFTVLGAARAIDPANPADTARGAPPAPTGRFSPPTCVTATRATGLTRSPDPGPAASSNTTRCAWPCADSSIRPRSACGTRPPRTSRSP